ncbi:peptidoglycan editing factor PgeF [Bdellovibrionota bacterium]
MENNQKFFQSIRFSENEELTHGFSTRIAGEATTPEQAGDVIKGFGLKPGNLQLMRQVHKDGVVEIKELLPNRPEADSMITNQPNIILGIRTADCVPLLIFDQENMAIAAVHAGWRSAAERLPIKTLKRMKECFGTDPSRCQAVVGPAIGACCYEVGKEVIGHFPSRFVQGESHLDLPSAVIAQLEDMGVSRPQVFWVNECTACNPSQFFSHRRDSGETGRHLSFITLRSQK